MSAVPTCGVCGAPFDAADPPPRWSLDPAGRPTLSKPIRVDPETGAICWCAPTATWQPAKPGDTPGRLTEGAPK